MRSLAMLSLAVAVLAAPAAPTAGPAPADPSARVQPVADGARWLPGRFAPGRQPDGNSVFFDGPAGTLLVDTGRHVEHTRAALAVAGPAGPAGVLVTHWHLDHLGGVALLRATWPAVPVYGAASVAPALGGWLANSRREMQAALAAGKVDAATQAMMRIDLALIDAGERLRPDTVIAAPRTLTLTGRPLEVGVAPHAVTAVDLWVWDPASGVLAAGDLVTLPVPFFDTACAAGWQAALGRLAALPVQWLVPGHGPPMSRADFLRWHQAFDALLTCAATDAPAATCADGWIAGLGALLPLADHGRARAMLDYYVGARLRAPQEPRDADCR